MWGASSEIGKGGFLHEFDRYRRIDVARFRSIQVDLEMKLVESAVFWHEFGRCSSILVGSGGIWHEIGRRSSILTLIWSM